MDKLKIYELAVDCIRDACCELSYLIGAIVRRFSISSEGLTYIEFNPTTKQVRYYTQVDFEENIEINLRSEYYAILSEIVQNKMTATLFKVKILVNGRAEPDKILYTVGRAI